MSTQLDLELKTKVPAVSRDEVSMLLNLLGGRGWIKAELIFKDWRWVDRFGTVDAKTRDRAERKLRAIASASRGRVLSWPGSPGYKITREATATEIERAHKLKHQADEMAHRFTEIMRVWHGQKEG